MVSMVEKSNESRTYWDIIWKRYDNMFQDKLAIPISPCINERFLRLLCSSLEKGAKVLEIGVGGPSDDLIFMTTKGFDTHGIDFSKVGLRSFEKRARKCDNTPNLVLCDAKRLPFNDDVFDLVYSKGLLEHILDDYFTRGDTACLQEHIRIAKPGGRIVITVPNFLAIHMYFYINILHLREGIKEQERHYTFFQVKKMMSRKGLRNITILGIGIVPPFESLGMPGRIASSFLQKFSDQLETKDRFLSKCLAWFIAAKGIKR